LQLRPYQSRAVIATRAALSKHRAVCLTLQVGGGKTIIACEMIRLALERGRRCLFVVHRIELVEQAHERLARFGIEAGVIKAGYPERRDLPVQVACVPTLVRREFPPSDLTILDEAHHAVSESWLKVANHYRSCGWLVGITATPQRLDGRGLGTVFDTLIEPVQTAELVRDGFLIAPTVYVPPDSCDRAGLRVQAGDYALPELAERMVKLTGSITEYWQKYGRGRRVLAFAVNIDHSLRIRDALIAVGARAMHVDGSSSTSDRHRANQMLRAGELDVVSQCSLWTEGVDIPEVNGIIVARPTKSLSLHRQILGRGMRPAPGKTDVIVLDHAGNHHDHGEITDAIEWSLDATVRRKSDAPPVRTCKECFAIIGPGLIACPACGTVVPARDEAEKPGVENDGELVRFASRKKKLTDGEFDYADWVRYASMKRFSIGWARNQYKQKYGTWPRHGDLERELYRCLVHRYVAKTYGFKRVERCELCYHERHERSQVGQ
jgi:DNA repair protein RadD